MFMLDLEKAEEPEIKLPTSIGQSKSKRVPEKYLLLFYWLHQSLCVDHNKLWKIPKEMGIPVHLTYLLKICMPVKKQQLELDVEQQTGF